MVIFLHCEMEDDGRRRKTGIFKWVFSSSRSSPSDSRRKRGSTGQLPPPRERRPLRSVPLVGPHYRVEPEVLVNEFVEKETKYLGTVTDLPCDFDASDRVSLLKIVDEQQTVELLPRQVNYENDVIVSFSVHNIKLLRRDGEKLIHRMQTHKIAAVGYVRDDNQHLVFIKFASELNAKMCNLVVLCCATKTAAEEVCSLAQQVFQLVYTDSTIDFLDKSIMDGAITPKNHSYSTDDSDKKDTVTVSSRDYATYSLGKSVDSLILIPTSKSSTTDTNGHPTAPPQWAESSATRIKRQNTDPLYGLQAGSSSTFPQPLGRELRQHRRSGSSGSSSNNNINPVTSASATTLTSPVGSAHTFPVHRELQLHDYITVLKEQLTNEELKEFAHLLNRFRTGAILIQEFSSRLLEMYTQERKTLLLGMRHFIPDTSDLTFFNKFLKENNCEDVASGDITSSSWWAQGPRITPRTFSETEESSTSASAVVGQATGLSLSSSSSERASASIVSNDDTDVIGNIERLGVTADVSTGTDLNTSRRKVNGTPPERSSSGTMLELDPPLYMEAPVSRTLVPPVAAVPEGFRDAIENVEEHLECSDSFSEETYMEKEKPKDGKEHKSKKKPMKKEKRKLKRDMSTAADDSPASETTPTQGARVKDSESSTVAKSQHDKPQKEHRKKKKHKKESTSTIKVEL